MGGVQCCLATRASAKSNVRFRRDINNDMELRKRAWIILQASKTEFHKLIRFSMGDKVEVMRSGIWRPATVLRVSNGLEKIQVRWDDTFRLEWVICGLGDIRLQKK